MVEKNDIGVSLVDEEEDLLEYDDSMGDDEDNGSRPTSHETDEPIRVVSESDIRQAAEMLLKQSSPKVLVSHDDDSFFLFNHNDGDNDEADVIPIICGDPKVIHSNCTELFASIRTFMEDFYGKLVFLSKEILFEIPCLDIILCEDNVYNSQITFSDIATIFSILKERSESNSEENVPSCMEARITVRRRFVSRYNALVELTQNAATLRNIRPFTNDKGHPLVLDDNASFQVQQSDAIVMTIDEEDEATGKERYLREKELSQESKTLGDNSDELLEIIGEENDL